MNEMVRLIRCKLGHDSSMRGEEEIISGHEIVHCTHTHL